MSTEPRFRYRPGTLTDNTLPLLVLADYVVPGKREQWVNVNLFFRGEGRLCLDADSLSTRLVREAGLDDGPYGVRLLEP